MKLKSLFLASLAAMAMVSCSNDNDPINADGGNVEKNAVMQFRIGFGNPTTTRTDETNGTDGGQEAGLDKEQKFANALFIAAYENGDKTVIVKTITRNEFTPTTDPATDGKYYQSAPFEVESGKIKAYVILNPTDIMASSFSGTMSPADVESALEAIQLSTLPTAENTFVMYGASSALQEVAANKTTQVSVAVDRVVAKLKEETAANKLSTDVNNNFNGQPLGAPVTVTLTGYAFTNLTDKSNLVHQANAKVGTFVATSVFDGTNLLGYTYNGIGAPAADKQITYCWENENAETEANKGDNITSIVYKAKITITGNGHVDGENVYVFNNTAYNYKGLKDLLKGLTLTDKSSIAAYDAIGIFKYENGICYYRQPILTGAARTINRNNVYKLSVKSISSIGYPTTVPAATKTMIQLYIDVNKWAVNVNEFEL